MKYRIKEKVVNEWMLDLSYINNLVDLFIENVNIEYISYGEVLCGRAISHKEWNTNLKEILETEIKNILSQKTNSKIACSFHQSKIIAFAIVNIEKNSTIPYAFLEDIVVDNNCRKYGIGTELINFIEKELQQQGIHHVYLESGINNTPAHNFFHERKYSTIATVMYKNII